ncbi:hypothetical protein HYE82_21635 [Streptomyces sp. BR123]|uniref:DUF6777 domain-containing protein n=1 Tax=Streptomyces sp. BR123 TaxID=2749828 RepID=UPI0015C49246|nr:DUF6777 domain-containing protein [Streptomyces sp. BR123]NXY96936.1 hypothetical protein [Streptomyces sp. BR123]
MPRVAAVTSGIAVAVVLTVVLTRPSGGPAQAGEVILQPASASGPDPFTPSTANTATALPAAAPVDAPTQAGAIRSVSGGEVGLYGGTRNSPACDVEKQIRYVTADTGRNKAFASSLNVQPSAVPGYLRSLTPLQLRSDTRVTNHGYKNGTSTGYQSVLQSGTAVLVDGRGEPKVRCACGNPLARAVAQRGTPKQTGTAWSGYRPQNVVVVNRAPTVIKTFVILDVKNGNWVRRQSGDHGHRDTRTSPPRRHWPLPLPPTKSPHTRSPATLSPDTRSPGTKSPGTKSPGTKSPGTKSPGTKSPGTLSPGVKPPATQSPATKPPATLSPGAKTPATPSPATKPPATPSPGVKSPATESPASLPATKEPGAKTPEPPTPASVPPVTKEPGTPPPAASEPGSAPPPPSPAEPATPAAPVSPAAPVTPEVPAPGSVVPEPRATEPVGPEPVRPEPEGPEPPAPPPADEPPGNGNQE